MITYTLTLPIKSGNKVIVLVKTLTKQEFLGFMKIRTQEGVDKLMSDAKEITPDDYTMKHYEQETDSLIITINYNEMEAEFIPIARQSIFTKSLET